MIDWFRCRPPGASVVHRWRTVYQYKVEVKAYNLVGAETVSVNVLVQQPLQGIQLHTVQTSPSHVRSASFGEFNKN